jgi:hypothetical protein
MSIIDFLSKIKSIGRNEELSSEEFEIDISHRDEEKLRKHSLFDKLFLTTIIILVSALSYGAGRLTSIDENEAVRIEFDTSLTANIQELNSSKASNAGNETGSKGSLNADQPRVSSPVTNTEVVVSKNGSKYHYAHCSGAKQIKEENLIRFSSPQAAETAGYTLAANCKPR